jgi:hypothetical protein
MAVEAIAGAAGQLFGMAGQFAQARNTKMQGRLADKSGFQDTQSRLLQLRQQREQQKQILVEQQARTRRITILVVSIVLGLIIISAIIFWQIKSKNQ